MTPSLPTLPAVSGGSGHHLETPVNIPSNQTDSRLSGGFQEVLSQAYDAPPASAVAEVAAVPGEQELPVDLQSLPGDGNLLPLLQQLIDSAAAGGADPRELLENIAARLERPGSDSGPDAAERMYQALQQLIDGGVEQTAVVPADAAALAAGYGTVPGTLGASTDAAGRRLPQLVEQLRLSDSNPAEHGRLPAEAGREQQGSGAGKLLEPVYHAVPETGQRSTELLAELVGLKHPGNSLKPTAAVVQGGPEPVSAMIAQTAPQGGGPAGGSGIPTVSVEVPVQQANWDQALGERIQWLMGQRLQGAQIKLNPAHLGPMEVRIQMQHDQASIQFTSAHAVVREALEAALPRLRDMFESAGVELLNVDVSGQSPAHQQSAPEGRQAPAWQRFTSGREEAVETVLETAVDRLLMPGRLDLFA